LATACRKVSHHAKVAWQKTKLVRRIGTQENWTAKRVLPCRKKDDPQCESDMGERTPTQGQVRDNSASRTLTEWTSSMRCWVGPECNNAIRDRGLKQKLHFSKRIKDLGSRPPLCPRNEKTSSWIYRKTIDSTKIATQKAGPYAASQKIKDWTLWRGQPPPKRKKKTAQR
jgi:hypothetical protein